MVALSPVTRKLLLRHGDLTEIATKAGVSVSHVSAVLKGARRSRRIQKMLARKMGRRLTETFSPEELGEFRAKVQQETAA